MAGSKKGEVLIYTLYKTFPLLFTGRKLRPPGKGIEASTFVCIDGLTGRVFSWMRDRFSFVAAVSISVRPDWLSSPRSRTY